jgi:hypothetical protein
MKLSFTWVLRYGRTQAAPTQTLTPGSVIGWHPMPTGYPSIPCLQPQRQYNPRSARLLRTVMPPRKTSCQPFPTPSLRPRRQSSIKPPARRPPPVLVPTPPRAARWPAPVDRPIRPGRKAVQGSGHRASCRLSQGASTTPLAFGSRQTTHPQRSPGRLQWVSARARTPRRKRLLPRARQTAWPSLYGG